MANRSVRKHQILLPPLVCFLTMLAGVTVGEPPSVAQAQKMEVIAGGELEYQESCAVCHGGDGRGGGNLSGYLTIEPSDLTQLARRNGNRFPFWKVYAAIDGRTEYRGHGPREMPIWGDRFRADAGGDGKSAQAQAAGRILTLVFYLEHIQE